MTLLASLKIQRRFNGRNHTSIFYHMDGAFHGNERFIEHDVEMNDVRRFVYAIMCFCLRLNHFSRPVVHGRKHRFSIIDSSLFPIIMGEAINQSPTIMAYINNQSTTTIQITLFYELIHGRMVMQKTYFIHTFFSKSCSRLAF